MNHWACLDELNYFLFSFQNNRCYTGEQLLSVYGVSKQGGIKSDRFKEICPSLIQQQLTGACKGIGGPKSKAAKEHPTDAERKFVFNHYTISLVSHQLKHSDVLLN